MICSGAGLTARLDRYRENRDDGPGPAIAFDGSGLMVGEREGSDRFKLSSGAIMGTELSVIFQTESNG